MAKSTSSKKIGEVEILPFNPTETGTTETVAEVLPSMSDTIEKALKLYDPVTPAIKELEKEFLKITVSTEVIVKDNGKIVPADEENYKKLTDAIRVVVSKRTAVDDKRKELKAGSLEFGRRIDGRAKEITAMLQPLEDTLKQWKKAVDDAIAAKEVEIEELKNKKKRERHDRLIKANMKLIGSEYVWDSRVDLLQQETLAAINLELLDDVDFNAFVVTLEQKDADDKEKYEAAQKARAEQQKKLDDEARKLREEQDKLKKEVEDMKNQRYQVRAAYLTNDLKLATFSYNHHFCFWNVEAEMVINLISYEEVRELSATDYEIKLAEIKENIEQLKLEAEAKIKLKQDALNKQLEQKKLDEQKAEEERLKGLNDQEKFKDYVQKLLSVPAPSGMQTKKWTDKVNAVQKALKDFQN